MKVLGIESSCDETAAAVVDFDGHETQIGSNLIYSQVATHAPFGGIVPELASRKHIETLSGLVDRSLQAARATMDEIEGVAVTRGPGLIGSLLVGLNYAKALAWARRLPLVGVNHIEAHLTSIWIEKPDLVTRPFVGLVVSGGHTSLFVVRGLGDYVRMGSTRDDAVGEAYDKVAKLLGLPYPGGPAIDKLAREGNERAIDFPQAHIKDAPYSFSFSGLKTAVRNEIEKLGGLEQMTKPQQVDIAASFQFAAVRALINKAMKVLADRNLSDLVVTGGVAANSRLREECERMGEKHRFSAHFPRMAYCTDNAAMIAALGARYLAAGVRDDIRLSAASRLPVGRAAA